MMILSIILLLTCIILQCNAFGPTLIQSKINRALLRASSSPIGDLLSGITGVAPSSLTPPLNVLRGTSLDPEREDVDLGRVYKVSSQGEFC